MGNFTWCTDIHLDCLRTDEQIIAFGEMLRDHDSDGVFLTGDISLAPNLTYHLSMLEKAIQKPIYFVLGNHDYYLGSVSGVRSEMKDLSNMSSYLRYMPSTPYVALSKDTALVGHDGWYDALFGDWKNSNFLMSDWFKIKEFLGTHRVQKSDTPISITSRDVDKLKVVEVAQKLALEGVQHVHDGIKSATRYHKNIIVLTHFPPFQEVHIYEGRIGTADAQPWYTSKLMGTMLKSAAKAYPEITFTVLCGHTHGKCDMNITHNLSVHVGGADYGKPEIQQLITVP